MLYYGNKNLDIMDIQPFNMEVAEMILFRVDDRKFGKYNIEYSIIFRENDRLNYSGVFNDFGKVCDKYYELKDEFGSSNVKMILK